MAPFKKPMWLPRRIHTSIESHCYNPEKEYIVRKVIQGTHGNVILEITDTTGSHQFPAMRKLSIERGNNMTSYFQDSFFEEYFSGHAFVLVFSVSSKQSLTELKPIVELINEVSQEHICMLRGARRHTLCVG